MNTNNEHNENSTLASTASHNNYKKPSEMNWALDIFFVVGFGLNLLKTPAKVNRPPKLTQINLQPLQWTLLP